MRCKKVRRLLSLYIDDRLSIALREKVEAHLEGCAECSQELKTLKNLIQSIKSLPVIDLPEDFSANLHKRFISLTPLLKPHPPLVPRYALSGIIGLILLLTSTLYYLGFIKSSRDVIHSPQPQTQVFKKESSPSLKEVLPKMELTKKEEYKEKKRKIPKPQKVKTFKSTPSLTKKDTLKPADLITQKDISSPVVNKKSEEIVIRLDLRAEEEINNFKIELIPQILGENGKDKILTWVGDIKKNVSNTVLMPLYLQLGKDFEIKIKVNDNWLIPAKLSLPKSKETVVKTKNLGEKEFDQIIVMSFIPVGKLYYSLPEDELPVKIEMQAGMIEFLPLTLSRSKMIPNLNGSVELVTDGDKVEVTEFQMLRRY